MMVPPRVVIFVLTSVVLPLHAADTGVYRGPENSGVYPEKGLLKEWPPEGPKLLWKYPLNQGYAGVAVVSGLVYIAHGAGVNVVDVFTLEGERRYGIPTGNASWKRFSGTRSTPIVEGDVVVTTTPDAHIYGIDLRAQNVRWKLNAWTNFGSGVSAMGWGLPESPMYHDGSAVFNVCSRSDQTPPVVAVDVQSGRAVWGADPGTTGKKYSAGDVSGACFRHSGRALVAYPTWRCLLCLDANTGRRLWEIPDTSEKTLTPCYGDGRLLWDPSGRSQMLKLSPDGSTYEVLWTRYNGVPGWTHAVILDGRAYLFGNPYLIARPPAEQSARLVEEGTGYVFAPPDDSLAPESVRTNGPRAVADWKRSAERETHLLCLDADTGRLLQSRPAAEGGHIIAADGMVYVLELLHQGPDKPILPRVSLIRPTTNGFETTGTLVPPFDAQELRWSSLGAARNEQHRQWAREDFTFQKNVNPAIAEGRLFLRYGPLQVYDLRGRDWKPQPTAPPSVSRGPDLTYSNAAHIADSVPADARQHVADLASRYLDERTNAVQALISLSADKQKQLLPAMVRLLDVEGDRAWLVQQCAAAVLRTNGAAASSVAPQLRERTLSALDKGNGHLAECLFATLAAVSPAAMTQAVASVGSRLLCQDPVVRRQSMSALKTVGTTASAVSAPLAECLVSDDRRMVNESAAILKKLESEAKPAVPALQAGLTNVVARKDAARVALMSGLLQGVDSNGVSGCAAKLAILAADPDCGVAGLALQVLNGAGVVRPEIVAQLVSGLKSADRRMAEQSALMLNRLGPRAIAAVEPLTQYVVGETGTLRVVAAELLGRIGPAARAGVEALSAGVRTNDLPFARASAAALGRIGADAAPGMSNLVTAVAGRDVELARASAAALGAIGSAVGDAAVPPLLAALRHGDETVRSNAVAALRAINRDPVPPLVAILKGGDKRLSAWAASALGRLGPDARAAALDLVSSLRDRDGHVVLAAVGALGRIGQDAAAAVPDLVDLSRAADGRMGETIQRSLDRIKTCNQPPTAIDAKAVCEEGKTVMLSLQVDDPDDAAGTLEASVLQGPAFGSLARRSNTQFVYRAACGGAGYDVFIWRAGDRKTVSGAAVTVITVPPDRTPPAVARAFMWTNAPSVRVEFDEPLATNVAMDIRNYRVEPDVRVDRVQMDTNGMGVSLHTGPVTEGKTYTVGLRKLRDRSKAGNALTARLPLTCLSSGLACAYYESVSGIFDRELFDVIEPRTNGVASRIDLSLRQKDEFFDMMFHGFLRTKAAGDYTFWVSADDRARLYIGANMVVESTDGRERSGSIRLGADVHHFSLIYMQTKGTNSLDTAWSGPGFRRQPIPPDVLYHLR